MNDVMNAPADELEEPQDEVPASLAFDDVMGEEPAESVEDTTDAERAAAPESAPAEPAPVAEPEPFAFNAFKQRYEVPGLKWNPSTNSIQVEDPRALDRLKGILSQGREWEARGRQELIALRKETQQLKAQPHPELEQAKAYLEEFQRLMTMPEQELQQFLVEARTQWPKMEARAERAYAERLMEQARAAQAPPEPDVELVVQHAQTGAAEVVQEILANQPWATPQLAEKLTARLTDQRTMNQWIARATRDMPEQGLHRGQYVADWDAVRELVDEYTAPYRDAFAQRTTAAQQIKTTQQTATRNAAALSRAKSPPPAAPVANPAAKPARPQDVVRDAMKAWNEMQR